MQAGTAVARAHIPSLRRAVLANGPQRAAIEWLETLDQALERAGQNATALLAEFDRVAERAAAQVNATDFGFLYDRQRHAFHIGLNLEADRLDNNYYDLLASEARIASIIAIAKGDVPQALAASGAAGDAREGCVRRCSPGAAPCSNT